MSKLDYFINLEGKILFSRSIPSCHLNHTALVGQCKGSPGILNSNFKITGFWINSLRPKDLKIWILLHHPRTSRDHNNAFLWGVPSCWGSQPMNGMTKWISTQAETIRSPPEAMIFMLLCFFNRSISLYIMLVHSSMQAEPLPLPVKNDASLKLRSLELLST